MFKRALAPIALFAGLLVIWEFYCRFSGVSDLILPAPSGIARAMVDHRAELTRHAGATAFVTLTGFSLSIGFAFLCSIVLHHWKWAEQAVLPLLAATQTIPLIALAPLMILWFGFGLLPKVVLVILVTFFPITLSLLSAYRQTPQAYIDLLASMRATKVQIFRRVKLPAARAGFFAGLRISGTYAVVATIFAEYAGARSGLGIFILTAKNNFRADLVLAAVVLSALMTLSLVSVLNGLERLSTAAPRSVHGA